MKSPRGFILAACHVALVLALGGKLLLDRATMPRLWIRTEPVDPSEPIRGRYLSLGVSAVAARVPRDAVEQANRLAHLRVVAGQLLAEPWAGTEGVAIREWPGDSGGKVTLAQPLAFFLPEHVGDPSRRNPGEELWVEVTVPRRGPPRPIQLGVKREGGPITPLETR